MSRPVSYRTVQTRGNARKVPGATVGEVRGRLQSLLDGFLARFGPICVLEAGCGSLSHFKLGEESRIVGIDLSQQQLERNAVVDESILGDIQTYPLRENDFDVVMVGRFWSMCSIRWGALSNLTRSLSPRASSSGLPECSLGEGVDH